MTWGVFALKNVSIVSTRLCFLIALCQAIFAQGAVQAAPQAAELPPRNFADKYLTELDDLPEPTVMLSIHRVSTSKHTFTHDAVPPPHLVFAPALTPVPISVHAAALGVARTSIMASTSGAGIPATPGLTLLGSGAASASAAGSGQTSILAAAPALVQAPVVSAAAPAAPALAQAPTVSAPAPSAIGPTAITPAAAVPSGPVVAKPITLSSSETPFAPEGDLRRGLPAPLDPVFPGTEYVGQPVIGAPDESPVFPLEAQIYKYLPVLKAKRIQIYGWANPGGGYSSSHKSNIPLTYAVAPNKLEMEQLVLRIERSPDTVQQEHTDWGFRLGLVYGIDYRWTTAYGWYPASSELLKHNDLYGFDPVECYGLFYVPKIGKRKLFQGLSIRYGRYISPPDIEAQLSPDNYLWTHSVMFAYDAYTHTGIQGSLKLNDQWMYQLGIHSGSDMAPWTPTAIPTLETYLRWVSKNNNNSLYFGIDSLNNGRYRGARAVTYDAQMATALNTFTNSSSFQAPQTPAHDNLQQFNVTYAHRFSRRLHTMTEAYYLYSFDALQGGTVSYGPPHNENALTGPGAFLPGTSRAWGFVNYTNYKVTDKDYITLRPIDYLIDERGWRTGFPTTYASWTLGWCHRFSELTCIRPEIRYERALNYHNGQIVTPYDNGTKRSQFTFGLDLIRRF